MTNRPLKKLSLQTIGCRLNQYETERIAKDLVPMGFRRTRKDEVADLYIINTCTVTHRADSDARNLIRRAVRANPSGRVVVTGCYVNADADLLAAIAGVDAVIPNEEKDSIADIISEKFPELFSGEPDHSCSDTIEEFYHHNRAWIKISDGCNQRCSYCIIPHVRGPLRNRPATEIIDEINHLVVNGYREVVLTGVNIGHYKNRQKEPHVKNLATLCRMIMSETDLYRLRISSIEPQTVRDEMIDVFEASEGRICRHFHVPLQSGSAHILGQMRRPYGPEVYVDRVQRLKAAVPGTIVGGDVIVGFPGETEDHFNQTRQLVESGLIDYVHVFSYSDRPGVAASQFPAKINPEIIRKRRQTLAGVSDQLRQAAFRRQVGQTLEVISECKAESNGFYWAVADNYIRVRLPAQTDTGREVVRVKVTKAFDDHVEGDLLM
jgi:threonylcarbamoyladenosine tRNA methylthiotransferase MtaB